MTRFSFAAPAVAAVALIAFSAQAALPITPGAYVRDGVPCQDAPLAAVLAYDGKTFSGPHESDCATTVLSRRGQTYRLKTTCHAAGDGSPAAASTQAQTVTVRSASHITFGHTTGAGQTDRAGYRLCPAASQR